MSDGNGELDRGAVQHLDNDSDRLDRGAVEVSNDLVSTEFLFELYYDGSLV